MKSNGINLWNLLLLGCLALAAGTTRAEDAPRYFEIELLVFENLINSDSGEVWPVDYSDWFEDPATVPGEQPQMATGVTWLPVSAGRLSAERNALGRSPQYRPVTYLAWRQAVLDRSSAQPIQIPVDGTGNRSYVDGTVRVAVERYLHLYLDLQLHSATAGPAADTTDFDLPEIRLTEHRRMRSKEVHYFDHPRFGVIALITPFDPVTDTQP